MNTKQWRHIVMIWAFLLAFVPFLTMNWLGGHITFTKLFASIVMYDLISYGIVFLWSKHKAPSSRSTHPVLRALSYLWILFAFVLAGTSRGFEFAWDPNTTFQFWGFGRGWESTAWLGGLIGLGVGILASIILELAERGVIDKWLASKYNNRVRLF